MNSLAYNMNIISNKTHDNLFLKGEKTYKLFEPGMCFLAPWIFSPLYLTDETYIHEYSNRYFDKLLSFDYWTNWRKRRPPVSVVLPNKNAWCLDERINNVDRQVCGTFPEVSVDKPLVTEEFEAKIENGVLYVDTVAKKAKQPTLLDSFKMF